VSEADAFLVLRRGGATWAVAQPEVRGLVRRHGEAGRGGVGDSGAGGGGAFEVTVAGGPLAADEVLGVASGLRLHPAGPVLRRFWPEAARGLAVHGARPLVLIDPSAPPQSLLAASPGPEPPPEEEDLRAAAGEREEGHGEQGGRGGQEAAEGQGGQGARGGQA
jgi:hypothetical protein